MEEKKNDGLVNETGVNLGDSTKGLHELNNEITSNEAKKTASIGRNFVAFEDCVVASRKVLNLLEQDNLPFIPNKDGFCNTKPVMNAVSNNKFTGINMLMAKIHLHEQGRDNDNILTFSQAAKSGTVIKRGEQGFNLSFYDKNENKLTKARYFAASQTKMPDVLPYQRPPAESSKEVFVQKSGNTRDYITNYLRCVDENRGFTASKEAVNEFKQNFAIELKSNPLQLLIHGREAGKTIYKEKNPSMDKEKSKVKEMALARNTGFER